VQTGGPSRRAGSPEFMAAYQVAMSAKVEQPAKPGSGTVSALIVDYLCSPAFASNLEPESKKSYGIVLDKFGAKHGHRTVVDMPRDRRPRISTRSAPSGPQWPA